MNHKACVGTDFQEQFLSQMAKDSDLEEIPSKKYEFKEENTTKSQIVVKADGSKVLVVTMQVAGMQTTMSLEISKPTGIMESQDMMREEEKNVPSKGLEEVNEVTQP